MQTRCKPGDMAVILYDEPSCLCNVGRLVKVHPSLMLNKVLNLDCWLIEPIQNGPWALSEEDGTVTLTPVSLADRIEHPDCWMLPIRDEQPLSEKTLTETSIQQDIEKRVIAGAQS